MGFVSVFTLVECCEPLFIWDLYLCITARSDDGGSLHDDSYMVSCIITLSLKEWQWQMLCYPVQVEPPEDIEVPASLLSEEEVATLVAERKPAYVPLARGDGVTRLPPPDPATGNA